MIKINRSAGFAIIEVMIAMALGLFLLAIMSKIYLSTKAAYYTQMNTARLQENGRLASYILTRNIRMSGYAGCRTSYLTDSVRGFRGVDAPGYLQGKAVSGSDIIIIKKADTAVTHLTKDIERATSTISVIDNPATKSNRQLLISDCKEARLFMATNLAKRSIKVNAVITHNYKKLDAEVARFTKIAYFVGKTSRINAEGGPIYALYSVTNEGRKQELVEGVEDMHIEYGVDTNNDGHVDGYYPAGRVINWDRVLAVDVTLDLNAGENKTKPWRVYIALQERIR